MREKPVYKSPLLWACMGSMFLLAFFFWLQAVGSRLISLPVQWVWVSVLPILLVLVVGGYIKKFKAPGFEFEPGIQNLPYYPPSPTDTTSPTLTDKGTTPFVTELRTERDKEVQRTDRYFLLHVCKTSAMPGQKYDIRIFLIRHVQGPQPNQKEGFTEVEKAEFYFGKSWGDRVFVAKNEGSFIGVSTSAWGTFLATCRLTFKDSTKPPVILYRYIDFEMAPPQAV